MVKHLFEEITKTGETLIMIDSKAEIHTEKKQKNSKKLDLSIFIILGMIVSYIIYLVFNMETPEDKTLITILSLVGSVMGMFLHIKEAIEMHRFKTHAPFMIGLYIVFGMLFLMGLFSII